MGSPPHARGKAPLMGTVKKQWRITPACAGKSRSGYFPCRGRWDHPRMRGEKSRAEAVKNLKKGSPPHARGKAGGRAGCGQETGITPACAGKSPWAAPSRPRHWDHPRMRGEKMVKKLNHQAILGSPPHARGKGAVDVPSDWCRGITPACAGKSSTDRCVPVVLWDHPRMRGEKQRPERPATAAQGSPPHARGKAVIPAADDSGLGITPACAGKSVYCSIVKAWHWDHPRMRGEKLMFSIAHTARLGSPPHARGKDGGWGRRDRPPGITPACAGKSRPDWSRW